ncbi:hypothetical protein DRO41_01065 [Candidatus Bathyarchaeota archaeon]|nr:MAG: hypothetical protein DRO41_01065 [Candidatus Bathyarchaeota archaeon]
MKELLKEIRKLKNNKIVRVGSNKVSTLHLKCMDHDFLFGSVNGRRKMPESIGAALIYLIKNGYVQLKPTHAGYEFASRALGAYELEEMRKREIAKERRRIRSIVLKGKFKLDEIAKRKYNATILGHYDEGVMVTAFEYGRYVKLQKGDIMTFVGSGTLYNKLINDINNTLRSPKGRLWLVRTGVGCLERYLRPKDTLKGGGP